MSAFLFLFWCACCISYYRVEVAKLRPKALCAPGPDELEIRFVQGMRVAVMHGRLGPEDMRELVEVLDIPLASDLKPTPPFLRPFVCPDAVEGGPTVAEAWAKWRHYIWINHVQYDRALEKWNDRNPSYELSVSRWYQRRMTEEDEQPTQAA